MLDTDVLIVGAGPTGLMFVNQLGRRGVRTMIIERHFADCRLIPYKATSVAMKKLKHEAELYKAALLAAMNYATERGAVVFDPTDSASDKLLYVYRLLVHDKVMQPLPEDQVAEDTMRHKLAVWYSKQLPKDHPLLI
jgi:2-polyprenyl-6-methoxyphenol hydroxylase-like FAD-dependent oxidoreductase